MLVGEIYENEMMTMKYMNRNNRLNGNERIEDGCKSENVTLDTQRAKEILIYSSNSIYGTFTLGIS